ncbi:putative serine-rich protein C215.13-like [Senna tora]|uniref:Putative serine-rich protein C215.13-like n=1 Tax=Senna tora TaxID=362788 RepID=A0A834W726_9FABA|nr:putative serine-rich protein C215.13-like [Senna tora]
MAASSRKSSSSRGPILRSLSPSGSFSSRSTTFFHRSTSPTRVNLCGSSASVPSVRFSVGRSISPNQNRSIRSGSVNASQVVKRQSHQKRTCMCSPTTHPGSFRCSLHKGFGSHSVAPYSPNRLNARRSAMTNSLVRIGGVEGDLVKRALAALIRPSSHQQRRRADFQPRPSRLSNMSKSEVLSYLARKSPTPATVEDNGNGGGDGGRFRA